MISNLDAYVIFDLENCVYLAKNRLQRMICQGDKDPALDFSEWQISEPVGESILSILVRMGIAPGIVLKVASKETSHLLSTSSGLERRISKDFGYFNLTGSQSADREIRKILDHIYNTFPVDMPVILVSGDGGFIYSMQKLIEKGHTIRIVSPEWGLNGAYYSELGEDFVIPLKPDWINEVIRLTIKRLPYAA